MADAPMNGNGSGRGGDDSDGGKPPKRPRTDEPAPKAGPSNEQASAGRSRRRAADFQQPALSRRQREQDWLPPGPDLIVVRTKADLHKWIEATWPMVWAQMRQPGPLVDPYYWARVPRETLRQIERHHHARLVNFWESIIRHYRGIQPMEVVRNNRRAQEEQVAPQLPPEEANVPEAGPQEAMNANGQAVVAGPGEQAVPEVDIEGDGDGDDAEAEPRM